MKLLYLHSSRSSNISSNGGSSTTGTSSISAVVIVVLVKLVVHTLTLLVKEVLAVDISIVLVV